MRDCLVPSLCLRLAFIYIFSARPLVASSFVPLGTICLGALTFSLHLAFITWLGLSLPSSLWVRCGLEPSVQEWGHGTLVHSLRNRMTGVVSGHGHVASRLADLYAGFRAGQSSLFLPEGLRGVVYYRPGFWVFFPSADMHSPASYALSHWDCDNWVRPISGISYLSSYQFLIHYIPC